MCNSNVANVAFSFFLLISLRFPALARSRSVGVEPNDGLGPDSRGYLKSLICLSLDFLEDDRYVFRKLSICNLCQHSAATICHDLITINNHVTSLHSLHWVIFLRHFCCL